MVLSQTKLLKYKNRVDIDSPTRCDVESHQRDSDCDFEKTDLQSVAWIFVPVVWPLVMFIRISSVQDRMTSPDRFFEYAERCAVEH